MKVSNLTIIPPEGMEYYIDNGEIRFREIKKNLTYNDIAEILFKEKAVYITSYGDIATDINPPKVEEGMYTTSKRQAEKLSAINKLLNVAKYLNGDWKPDWGEHSDEFKYYIDLYHNNISIKYTTHYNDSLVYFKSKELTNQAISILGEETIKLALCTDW